MRLRLRIQGELSILQIAQFVKRGNKNFYTTLPISDYSLVGARFAPVRQMRQTAKPESLNRIFLYGVSRRCFSRKHKADFLSLFIFKKISP